MHTLLLLQSLQASQQPCHLVGVHLPGATAWYKALLPYASTDEDLHTSDEGAAMWPELTGLRLHNRNL
jgi:hypothetical protein